MIAFLTGFREASGLSAHEADEQWTAHSRQLSDAARHRIERGGHVSGVREGKRFLANYPSDPVSTADTLMSLRIPRQLHAELSVAAREDERTIAATVRLAVREYLDRRKKQSQ